MSEFKTAFKDATASKMSFEVVDTLGDDPCAPVSPTSASPTAPQTVDWNSLPMNDLKHGIKD